MKFGGEIYERLATQILNKMKNLLFLMFLAGVISCKSDSAGPYNQSAGGDLGNYFEGEKGLLLAKQWKLTALETGEVSYSTVLEFKTQKNQNGKFLLSGKSVVNFYEATYDLAGINGITISNLSITEIAGNTAQTGQEKDFFGRLSVAETFVIRDGTLVLSNRKGEQLYFKSN